MDTESVKPKCPSCSIEGIEHIISSESAEMSNGGDAWFNVAYCSKCGHVYGVFTKVVRSPPAPMPQMPQMPPIRL